MRIDLEAVPHAVYGVDDLGFPLDRQLLPQTIDIDLDQIRFRIEVDVPDMFENLGSRYAFRRARHEELEQSKLFRGQRDRYAGPRNPALMAIHLQVAVAKQPSAVV